MDDKINILIVDDEPDIGFMLSRMLRKAGYRADYIERVKKAKELLDQGHLHDIYLLDLNLPDGTGFDLVPEVRKHQGNAIIFFISAHDGTYEKNKAKELEVNGFITKPFTTKEILTALKNIKHN